MPFDIVPVLTVLKIHICDQFVSTVFEIMNLRDMEGVIGVVDVYAI